MQIQTTRFGAVEVQNTDVISFPDGILGFADLKKFVILEDPDDLVFAWLQSCDNPGIAFPVLEPELFTNDYKVKLSKNDREALKLEGDERVRIFNIVTIPSDVTQMTANMKAPVVVNVAAHVAKQVVTQENDNPIKHPIFNELQQRLLQNKVPQRTAGPLTASTGVAVRITSQQTNKDANA